MKRLWLSLGLLALMSGQAFAGRNANGAMVLHASDQIQYCAGIDPCVNYPLPATCQDLVTRINGAPSNESLIWMVAAFPSNSSPGVNAFQVGLTGDITGSYFTAWSPCGPNFLEIPDVGWPGAGTGTAVAYGGTVYSILFKMYWFAVSAPGSGSSLSTTAYFYGDPHAEWADDSSPPVVDMCDLFGTVRWGADGHNDCPGNSPTGACCFPSCECQVLTQDTCESLGGVWYGAGTSCVPNPCSCPPGACCFPDGTCEVLDQAQCAAQGGTFQGIGTTCSPNPCLPPTGACCFCDGHCEEMSADACQAAGGSFLGLNVPCSPNPCPAGPEGACCIDQRCFVTTAACCTGQYQGDNTDCSPNPCIPTPTKSTTWGEIKAAYR